MSCSGGSSEVCGGSYSMSVFKNFDVDTAVESYHLGCFSDPADNRVFVQNESSDAMTAEVSGRAIEAWMTNFCSVTGTSKTVCSRC